MLVHRVVFHVLTMRPAYQTEIDRPGKFCSFGLAVLIRGLENFSFPSGEVVSNKKQSWLHIVWFSTFYGLPMQPAYQGQVVRNAEF